MYVVATPIGNLDDMTPRALKTLGSVGVIAAEDTRHTRKLLSHFAIKTPLISCFGDNESKRAARLVERLHKGESIALVSNAGAPGISDPGDKLVNLALDNDIVVIAIPGPSSLTSALSVSGVGGARFVFHGFLPRQKKRRGEIISKAAKSPEPQIFFEAPNRIEKLLKDLAESCPDRHAVIVREISKLHEECLHGATSELSSKIEEHPLRGEIVLILGWDREKEGSATDVELPEDIRKIMSDHNISDKAAAALIAAALGAPRRDVYQGLIALKDA